MCFSLVTKVDLVRMLSSVKITAHVGGPISLPNTLDLVLLCTVAVCACYVLDLPSDLPAAKFLSQSGKIKSEGLPQHSFSPGIFVLK